MNYFNDKEQAWQKNFAATRDKKLSSLLKLMIKLKITPNMLSVFAVLLLLIGVALPNNYGWFISVLIFSYCVIDGIDGPLARRLNMSNKGGALTDNICDHIGIALVPLAAVYSLGVASVISSLYSFSYILIILILLFANKEKIVLLPLVRTKYFCYFFYCSSIVFNQYLDPIYFAIFMGIFAFYHIVLSIIGLVRINKFYQ